MIIERLVVGPLETNCYLVGCPRTLEGVIIDPAAEGARITSRVQQLALKPTWIIDTHGHGDHIGANRELKDAYPEARIAVHAADVERLVNPVLNLSALFGAPVESPPPDVILHDGDEVRVGELSFEVIHVPGHTPGGAALYMKPSADETSGVLFCGDALFAGSIGRTDFPDGSLEQLVGAVRRRLLTLPPDTVVYPGHGESTTIGREAASNPFVS